MESYSRKTKSKSLSALVFLILLGVGFLLFGILVITCGFLVNYHDDFEASDGGQALESKVQSQLDYTQYWLGFPFLITSVLAICSGLFQNSRGLTIVTFICFFICIILSLFAMVLEGVDWVMWKNLDRLRSTWEDKNGFSCANKGYTCVCMNAATNKSKTVSNEGTCSNIKSLAGLFGAITASAIIGIFLSLAGIVIILKSLSWKPRHYFMEYNLQNGQPAIHHRSYKNEGYANGVAPRKGVSALY